MGINSLTVKATILLVMMTLRSLTTVLYEKYLHREHSTCARECGRTRGKTETTYCYCATEMLHHVLYEVYSVTFQCMLTITPCYTIITLQ